jgi:hypothetical protein
MRTASKPIACACALRRSSTERLSGVGVFCITKRAVPRRITGSRFLLLLATFTGFRGKDTQTGILSGKKAARSANDVGEQRDAVDFLTPLPLSIAETRAVLIFMLHRQGQGHIGPWNRDTAPESRSRVLVNRLYALYANCPVVSVSSPAKVAMRFSRSGLFSGRSTP